MKVKKLLRREPKFILNLHKKLCLCLSVFVLAAGSGWMNHPVFAAQETVLICDTEEHTHSDSCYETVLTCQLQASEGHEHTAECYTKQLICTKQEHVHSQQCWKEQTPAEEPAEETKPEETKPEETKPEENKPEENTPEEKEPEKEEEKEEEEEEDPDKDDVFCGKTAHTHKDSCYTDGKLTCTKEEHEHILSCFSDKKADLETSTDWENSVKGVELKNDYRKDLIAIAYSQLGTQESQKNYIVLADKETKKGYSRYGAWYGSPYGDWCAMFVSFCLNYAKIPTDQICREASCPRWVEKLKESGQYFDKDEYVPRAGDLIFFDYEQKGTSNHVGIVVEVQFNDKGELEKFWTIEGNVNCGGPDFVDKIGYSPSDPRIMGFGCLQEAIMPAIGEDGTGCRNYLDEKVSEIVNAPLISRKKLNR